MSHDANKVQMGSTLSSFKRIDNRKGEIAAGLMVRLKSDDTISIAAADGSPLGISCGKDLSNIGRTAIVREGTGVPVQLTAAFDPVIGTQVHISDTTGKAIASGAGATGMNAVYASRALDAIGEDGVVVTDGCALIDMPGGL
jgi:hypothetical protein